MVNPVMSSIQLPQSEIEKLQEQGFTTEEISEPSSWQIVDHNTFGKYKLFTKQLVLNGKPMGSVTIVKDVLNGFYGRVSENYQVVPHPYLQDLVRTVSTELDIDLKMAKGTERMGSWYKESTIDGSPISKDGRYMCMSYVPTNDVGVDIGEIIGGRKDTINAGITVRNTLDGTTSLSISPFTVRQICQNQMHHIMTTVAGWKGNFTGKIAALIKQKALETWEHSAVLQKKFQDQTDFLGKIYKGRFIHTKNIASQEEALAHTVAVQLQFAKDYLHDYEELARTKLLMTKVQGIVDAMPVGLNKQIKAIDVKRQKVKKGLYENVVTITDENKTEYDLLNDYTDILTHGDTSSTMNAQMTKMKKLQDKFNFGNLSAIPELTV